MATKERIVVALTVVFLIVTFVLTLMITFDNNT